MSICSVILMLTSTLMFMLVCMSMSLVILSFISSLMLIVLVRLSCTLSSICKFDVDIAAEPMRRLPTRVNQR